MSNDPPPDQFWLLIGEVPAGPFTVALVHGELAAGRATWQTLACPVGGSAWLPLVRTPGIGPSAPPRTAADTRSPEAHPPSEPLAPVPSPAEPAAGNLDGVFGSKPHAPASRSLSTADSSPSPAPVAAVPPAQPPAGPRRRSFWDTENGRMVSMIGGFILLTMVVGYIKGCREDAERNRPAMGEIMQKARDKGR